MPKLDPYLNFGGNTEEAFNFYKSVFGGEFLAFQRFSDMPGDKIPEKDRGKIMHISLPIGKGNILMGNDVIETMGQPLTSGNDFHIAIEAESKDEANDLYNGLSAGGKIVMAMQDVFWGAYFGQFTDKFGIQWMVNYTHVQNK